MAQNGGNDDSGPDIRLQRVPMTSLIIRGVQYIVEQDKAAKL